MFDTTTKPRPLTAVRRTLRLAYKATPGALVLEGAARAAASALSIAPPLLLGRIVDRAARPGSLVGSLVVYAGVWFCARAVSTALTVLHGRVEQRSQTEFIIEAMTSISDADPLTRARVNNSELSYAIDNGASGVRTILWVLFSSMVPTAVTLVVGAAALWATGGPVLSVIFLGAAALFVVVSSPLIRSHQMSQRQMMGEATRSFGVLQNSLAVWREARLHDADGFLRDRYRENRRGMEIAASRAYAAMARLSAAQAAVVYGALAAMLAVAASRAGVTPGAIVAIAGIAVNVLVPLETIGFGVSQISVGAAELHHVDHMLDTVRERRSDTTTRRAVRTGGVGLATSGLVARSLEGGHEVAVADLTLSPGRPAWVTGPSGSGKTTVLDALAGLGPGAGAVELDVEGSRVPISYLTQAGAVLEDSVFHNVSFGSVGRDAAADALVRVGLAASTVEASARLDERALGDGTRLSGGEERRMLLARAIAGDPAVLLCDEPTSGLDAANRERIWAIILEEAKHRVVVVATHDPDAPIDPRDASVDVRAAGSRGRRRSRRTASVRVVTADDAVLTQ